VDLLLIGRALLRCLGQFRLRPFLWWLVSLRLFPAACFRLRLAGALLSPPFSPLPVRLAHLEPSFFFRLGRAVDSAWSTSGFLLLLAVNWLAAYVLPRAVSLEALPLVAGLPLAVTAICVRLSLAARPSDSPEPVKLARLGPSFFRLDWAVDSAWWPSGFLLLLAGN
jgi:hypothetical protein